MALPKHTSSTSQRLQFEGKTVIIPANTSTIPSILAVHTHPKYWSEPVHWKPSRWVATDENGRESLIIPARNTYLPSSDGPQNCPGRKFSEVEFVAVIALLMQDCKPSIVREQGESEEQAKKRAARIVNDCDMQMLLRMRDAGQFKLKLKCQRDA
jgi:cytochrome P450